MHTIGIMLVVSGMWREQYSCTTGYIWFNTNCVKELTQLVYLRSRRNALRKTLVT